MPKTQDQHQKAERLVFALIAVPSIIVFIWLRDSMQGHPRIMNALTVWVIAVLIGFLVWSRRKH